MLKTYSRKADGNNPLTVNFKVSEFACKDGSDKILIDIRLVVVVQDIRDELGVTKINSGYRTPEYNKKVGGASNSYHMQGLAADIHVAGVDTVTVCKAAEKALARQKIPGAIIRYHEKNNFVHIDVRATRLRQENNGTKAINVAGWAEITTSVPAAFVPYTVKVTADTLNIRKGAGTGYAICGTVKNKDVYTIVEESNGTGAKKWGKLENGAGWIALDFTVKV